MFVHVISHTKSHAIVIKKDIENSVTAEVKLPLSSSFQIIFVLKHQKPIDIIKTILPTQKQLSMVLDLEGETFFGKGHTIISKTISRLVKLLTLKAITATACSNVNCTQFYEDCELREE